MLLLFDNAEHLLPGLAAELSALVAACASLRMLVTSRERLQVAECRQPLVADLGVIEDQMRESREWRERGHARIGDARPLQIEVA